MIDSDLPFWTTWLVCLGGVTFVSLASTAFGFAGERLMSRRSTVPPWLR